MALPSQLRTLEGSGTSEEPETVLMASSLLPDSMSVSQKYQKHSAGRRGCSTQSMSPKHQVRYGEKQCFWIPSYPPKGTNAFPSFC